MSFNRGLFLSGPGDKETPQELFNALNDHFDFVLDACATAETAKCPTYYKAVEDGLKLPWSWARRVWVNPPYGRRIGAWVKKGYEEGQLGTTVVMLLPSRTDTAWWHDYVMKAAEIHFIRGRLKFGDAKNGAPFPSAIVVFRPPLWV